MICFLASCKHDWRHADDFADSIRCGMTEDDIRRVATQFRVDKDHIWIEPSAPNIVSVKARELDFVDILLQGGKAVAVQRGNFIAMTTGMEFGRIRMLCGAPPLPVRRLRQATRL